MADKIRVDPDALRAAAAKHAEASEYLRAVPNQHAAIQESLDSLGPIFGELREAGRALLEERRACYDRQADDHAWLSENLTTSAARWDQHEADRAAVFRALPDDPRGHLPDDRR